MSGNDNARTVGHDKHRVVEVLQFCAKTKQLLCVISATFVSALVLWISKIWDLIDGICVEIEAEKIEQNGIIAVGGNHDHHIKNSFVHSNVPGRDERDIPCR